MGLDEGVRTLSLQTREILLRSQASTNEASRLIAQALQPLIPPTFQAKITLTIVDGYIIPSNVLIEMRPKQASKM